MTPEQLTEIEAIKKLKARYFRLMDTRQWEAWAEGFTDDARLRWGPEASNVIEGRSEIVATVSRTLADAVTCHHGHMPEIELLDAESAEGIRSAKGIWAMFDLVDHPDFLLRGFGHYHDHYVKQDGHWRIRSTRLTRLREERTPKTPA